MLIYEEFLGARGLPQTVGGLSDLAPFFLPAYYAGELPVFSGMGGHELFDPQSVSAIDGRRWMFWFAVSLFVILLLGRSKVWRLSR